MTLPEGTLLAYYGDDFTGSTDVLEVMAFSGMPTVLFVGSLTPERLVRFGGYRGVGVAGISRSKSPEWMDRHLHELLGPLFDLQAPITQYKICSTFDSSPRIGSIGRAIDIALPRAREPWSPMIVAAPRLRRYQAFGNLFAGVDGVRYRLDRHPTMSRHPITPMDEADLRLHLARQTDRQIALVDAVALQSGEAEAELSKLLRDGSEIVLFDVLDDDMLAQAGRLVWESRGNGLFSASSSGLDYALTAYWRREGWIGHFSAPQDKRDGKRPLLVVSGSCSPVTARQIGHAVESGFADIRLDGMAIADGHRREAEISGALLRVRAATQLGRSSIVYTASSPDDPAISALRSFCAAEGLDVGEVQVELGNALGRIAYEAVRDLGLDRLLVMGGDTAGRVVSQLPIYALTAETSLAPGAPVCKAYGDVAAFDGLEIILRGGQVGGHEFVTKAAGFP